MSIASRAALMTRHAARRAVGAGRVPDFLILGAQKAGTTSLFNYLCHSPQVNPPLRKEVHYFSQHDPDPLSWYKAFFPIKTSPDDVTGEATPFYMFQPQVAQRINQAGIKPRLIAILRCPVERAWSHYRHERRKGREALSFSDALSLEHERLRGVTAEVLDRAHLEALQRKSYLARGQYMKQLSRFIEIFGRDQLHVLSLDHLRTSPGVAVKQCCEFLGIASPPESMEYRVYNAGQEKTVMPDVESGIFRRAFARDLEKLSTLLPEAKAWLQNLPE